MSTLTETAVKVTVNGAVLEANKGETVLDVARRAGIDIPALCHQPGMAAWGACRLCMVEVEGLDKLQAACTTQATDGMVVRTDTPRVKARRESYLKMYLSDHNAYCEAPCVQACPAHVDIPGYAAALAAGEIAEASAIVRRELPFPGILGRVCQGYCEPACRRAAVDEPIAICALHRASGDHSEWELVPGPSTGKRVAIIGAGPAGLTAAWFLTESGHTVSVYDANEKPGGAMRYSIPASRLPESVIDKELQPLWNSGVRFVGASRFGSEGSAADLIDAGFDAVIVSTGTVDEPAALDGAGRGNAYTGRTSHPGVFATDDTAPDGSHTVIHAVASGKRAACAINAWLGGVDLEELERRLVAYAGLPYLDQLKGADSLGPAGRRLAERTPVWLKTGINAKPAPRIGDPKVEQREWPATSDAPADRGLSVDEAQAEAERCLQCVCPSLGECDLQRLGVEYGLVDNELVRKDSRVRVVEPQHEHPFIRRDMNRCIACGRCVRTCRDVAGPACYDFTGRGFSIAIDTPYSDPLQLADCISCGRCVIACPTGALTFNERAVSSFSVDESRCVLCGECAHVCPVDALEKTNHFEEGRHQWLELVAAGSRLAGGHRMCAGCGAPIAVRQVLMGTSDPVVVSAATGCLEVSTTIYPYTSWKSSYIHTAFENSAATLSGVETAFRALKKKGAIEDNVKFIAFGGDGGTYDIGLQSLSGAMERGHHMLYVCYDNGAYMNTGFQRSGATPQAAWTTTSPVGKEQVGKLQSRKNLTEIMVAHGIPYVAQASPHDPRDLVRKASKALAVDGPTFLNVLAPCPRGWRADGAETIDLARQAVNTCYWPLFEVEDGQYRLTYRPRQKEPLIPWLKRQGRFAHLFTPGNEEVLKNLEAWVDDEWEKLLRKCGEISEAENCSS